MRRPLALLLALVALPATGSPWSFAAHRLVHEKAAGTLPDPLRRLFVGNARWLGVHAADPDLWVWEGREGEAPNHYLDLDAFGAPPFSDVPVDEKEHRRRHGAEAAERGRLPWRVGEVHAELVAAFRARDAARVLERAAALGHYVADAHVPLHSVANHDGAATGQAGIHSRWETVLFERFERQLEPALAPAPAERIADPVAYVIDVLRRGTGRAAEVLAADREARGRTDYVETAVDERYDDAYYTRLFELEGERLEGGLEAAAHAVGSLWMTAWEQAGRPELDWSFRFDPVRGDSRVVVALLEGAGAALVEGAAERGALPHLDALRREGTTGRLTPPFPARRAAAQATLLTGAWPAVHGVAGDGAPRPSGSVLETDDGERSTALAVEPVWAAAARQGLYTVVVGVRQSMPLEAFMEEKRFGSDLGRRLLIVAAGTTAVEPGVLTAAELDPRPPGAWTGGETGDGAREVALSIAGTGTTVPGLLVDDPADAASGLDTLVLSSTRDLDRAVRLKPAPPGQAGAAAALLLETPGGPLHVHLRLFTLSGDGRDILLWHSEGARTVTSRTLLTAAARAEEGLLGAGAHRLYVQGALGPTLWQGGNGAAERRYLETVALAVRQHARHAALVLERTRWSLAVLALPFPEETLRLWAGRLDPALAGHDKALAARLRPHLDEALRLADRWVGEVARRVPEDAALAVVGDRGLGGVDRVVRPNVALRSAGLLATEEGGDIDVARTRAVYSPANGGFVVVNRKSRPGGVEPTRTEPRLRVATIAALGGMRDPVTDEVVVAELLEPGRRRVVPGIGGPRGGDLYARPAPGAVLTAEAVGPAVERVEPRGDSFDPLRPSAPGVLVLNGAGVAGGLSLGEVPAIDLAPTLAALLGLEPPAGSEGRALTRALSSEPR